MKEFSTFCGIPKSLVFTKTLVVFFGEDSYSDLIKELNIKPLIADSGFSSGVRVFRAWEEDIYFRAIEDGEDDFNELQLITNWNPKTTAFYSNLKSSGYGCLTVETQVMAGRALNKKGTKCPLKN